jgi:glycosyltransferase involved in cell wall biosynthesis
MRIVMVGRYPSQGKEPAGGVEVAVTRLADALAARGVVLTVVAPGAADRYRRGDVDVVLTPEDARLGLVTRLRRWRRAAARVLGGLEADLLHGQSLITCAIAATDDPRPIPKVVTAHGNVLQDVLAGSTGASAVVRRRLVTSLAREAVRRATAVVGVHPDRRLNVPVDVERFTYIPNIVDERFFSIGRAPVEPRVLYCGGRRHVKGWDVLAAAWPLVVAAVPAATLELLAWGEPGAEATFGGSPHGVDANAEVGVDAVAAAMSHAAVVVLPSRFELSPITLAEAWASGTPVVATGVGGVPELAGGAATLVPPDEPEALAAALIDVLLERTDTREHVAAGRLRSRDFRADAVVDAHLALYEELLAR